jgi:hypothetical protein
MQRVASAWQKDLSKANAFEGGTKALFLHANAADGDDSPSSDRPAPAVNAPALRGLYMARLVTRAAASNGSRWSTATD